MHRQRTVLEGVVAAALAAVVASPLLTALYTAPAVFRLATAGVRAEAERTASHLAGLFFDSSGLVRPEQFTPAFREEVARHLGAFNLERVKVFAASGEIVFSDDPGEEGKVNSKPYFREVVAAGRTHTTVVRRDARSQEGRRVLTDVVESYVPIMRGGRFAGALEVYYDISARTAEVDRFIGRLTLVVSLLAAALLAVVASLALRAQRALRDDGGAAQATGGAAARRG